MRKSRIAGWLIFVVCVLLCRSIFTLYGASPDSTRYARPGQKILVLKMGYRIDVGDLILYQAQKGSTMAMVMNKEGGSGEIKLKITPPDGATIEIDDAQVIGKVIWVTNMTNVIILILALLGPMVLPYIIKIIRNTDSAIVSRDAYGKSQIEQGGS